MAAKKDTGKTTVNKKAVIEKYGFIPTTLYIAGSNVDLSNDEVKASQEVTEALKKEGLING